MTRPATLNNVSAIYTKLYLFIIFSSDCSIALNSALVVNILVC